MARKREKYRKRVSQQLLDGKTTLYPIKGFLKMRYLVPLLGVLLGAAISGWAAYHIFQKQLLVNQYSIFAEDLAQAATSAHMWKARESDDSRKLELKAEAELYFNRAWSRALVTLPDEVFREIDEMIAGEIIDPGKRNKLFHLLRKELYPKTMIDYDTIKARQIGLDVETEK